MPIFVILVLLAFLFGLSGNQFAAREVVRIVVWGVAGGVALAVMLGVFVMSAAGR